MRQKEFTERSIKVVLPALIPELSYTNLEGVHDGGDAQLAWIKAAMPKQRKESGLAINSWNTVSLILGRWSK